MLSDDVEVFVPGSTYERIISFPDSGRRSTRRSVGVPFTAIRLRRTAYRFNVEHAEEAEADGIEEPYDGWPWIECEVGAPGAHPFWAFNDQDFSG